MQYFPAQDGVVMGLLQENVVYQSSQLGSLYGGFAFNIQPWAWDYLKKHPELIVIDALTDADGQIVPYEGRRFRF